MKLTNKDQTLLEQAYTNIRESDVAGRSGAAASAHIQGTDQTPYTQDDMGINTSHYKTKQPRMGKQDKLSDPQMQAALAILQQYAQGDISNVEAADMLEDLYKKGVSQGPTQDDMH